MEGIELEFEEDALKSIVSRLARKTRRTAPASSEIDARNHVHATVAVIERCIITRQTIEAGSPIT